MLKTIRQFFQDQILPELSSDNAETAGHGERLATAALLIEMSRADFESSEGEKARVTELVRDSFGLSEAESGALVELACQEAREATSLFQFTDLLNRHFSPEQKEHVVELLWKVAYADGKLHKYEEYLVRKIADLIYVPHSVFIRAKHRAQT